MRFLYRLDLACHSFSTEVKGFLLQNFQPRQCSLSRCCGILLTPLRWFKQIKGTVSFDVTTRFNAIQQSTAMYNSHIFNVRNTTVTEVTRMSVQPLYFINHPPTVLYNQKYKEYKITKNVEISTK